MPSEAGVAVYRHVFTFIDVVALPDGERMLRLRTEGIEVEFRLDHKCAAHLARLLISSPDATKRDEHIPAKWMGTGPVCRHCGTMGLSIEGDDGCRYRFRIPADSMRQLIEAGTDMLDYVPAPGQGCGQCRSQSDKSSGSPHAEGSISEGQSV